MSLESCGRFRFRWSDGVNIYSRDNSASGLEFIVVLKNWGFKVGYKPPAKTKTE